MTRTKNRLGKKKSFVYAITAKRLIGTNHVPLEKHWDFQYRGRELRGSSKSSISSNKSRESLVCHSIAFDAHFQVITNLCLIFMHSLRKGKANSLDSAPVWSWPR